MLLFRFNAPITFFNAPHFKRELIKSLMRRGQTYVTSLSTCFRSPTSMLPDCSPSLNWCRHLKLAAYD